MAALEDREGAGVARGAGEREGDIADLELGEGGRDVRRVRDQAGYQVEPDGSISRALEIHANTARTAIRSGR